MNCSKSMIMEIEKLEEETGIRKCIRCGKCTASCTLAEICPDFSYRESPRGIIESVKRDYRIIFDQAIWECLECEECTRQCVSGIDYRRFIKGLRQIAIKCGVIPEGVKCTRCGRKFISVKTMNFIINRTQSSENLKSLLKICPVCRQRIYSKNWHGLKNWA